MKYDIQVVTALDYHDLLDKFEDRLKWIREKEYYLYTNTRIAKEKDISIISLRLHGNHIDQIFRDEDIICIFKHQIAEVLAEHIVNDWENKLIRKIIVRNCKQLTAEDSQVIFDKSSEFIKKCHYNESINLLMNFGRKNRMVHKLLEHFENNNFLVIEGFINFCLPDYLSEIKFAVELAVEELKNEKEYNEFVKLLRYFVDTQVPRVFEVNLMMGDDGVFYLWDRDGEKIEEKYIRYYLEDMLLNEVNLDDVLISILITIAPRKIIIHRMDNLLSSEPVKMIKNVFQEKIVLCPGCERCFHYHQESHLKHGK